MTELKEVEAPMTKEVKVVTPEMKDLLLDAFIAEHKKFNGIPRYTTVEGAVEYFGIAYPEVIVRKKELGKITEPSHMGPKA